jgi:hypothetical protein
MNKRMAAAAAALLAVMATGAAAQSGWTDIGRGTISGDSGAVTIQGSSTQRWRELMFCTEGHEVRINEAALHYADNRTQEIRIRARIPLGGCSRMLSMNSRGQVLSSVDLSYDVASLAGGTVRVQLFAR